MQGIETGWLSALLLIDLIDSSEWLLLSNDDVDDDIYYAAVFVCVSVTKNDHFPLPSWVPEAGSELPTRPCRL